MSERLLDNTLKTSRNASQNHVLFLMFINWVQLKMQSESEDHLGNCSLALFLHHKKWNNVIDFSLLETTQLIDFIVNQWQYNNRINPNMLYTTAVAKCYNLSRDRMTEVSSSPTSQEKADTFYMLGMHWITCKEISILMQTLISKLVIKVKQLLVLLRSKNQHMRQRPKISMMLRSVLDLNVLQKPMLVCMHFRTVIQSVPMLV